MSAPMRKPLPTQKGSTGELSAAESLLLTSGEAPITILLVDDDPDCRMLVRDAISECNVSNVVEEVANGADALRFLRRQDEFVDGTRPGLIFLDIEMPVLNGLDTLKQIKADPELADIPVVMMTGVCEESQMKLAAELGANSYTLKPASADQFLKTVLASTSYWLTIHQYPQHHIAPTQCRR